MLHFAENRLKFMVAKLPFFPATMQLVVVWQSM